MGSRKLGSEAPLLDIQVSKPGLVTWVRKAGPGDFSLRVKNPAPRSPAQL
jgi:hypothetical protein